MSDKVLIYPTDNLAVVQLGTLKQGDVTPHSTTVKLTLQAGAPLVSLPAVFAPCDWATIQLAVLAVVGPGIPLAVTHLGGALPLPPPALPIVVLPWATPMSPDGSVTLPAPAHPVVYGPGIPSVMANALALPLQPGTTVVLSFTVIPKPGISLGVHQWTMELEGVAAKVTLACTVIATDHHDSSKGPSTSGTLPVARVGDPVAAPADLHGQTSTPVTGTIQKGATKTFINDRAAAIADPSLKSQHVACIGPNTFHLASNQSKTFVEDHPLVRVGDPSKHCGGDGKVLPFGSLDTFA